MRDAVELLKELHERKQAEIERLRTLVNEGIEQADRGELIDGEQVFAELRRKYGVRQSKSA